MVRGNPFGNERALLLLDLKGNLGALVELEALVNTYRRPPAASLGPPTYDPRVEREEKRRIRGDVERLRRVVRAAATAMDLFADQNYRYLPHPSISFLEFVTLSRRCHELAKGLHTRDLVGEAGRPQTLAEARRKWLVENTVYVLRQHDLNFRAARDGRLNRVVGRVLRAAGLDVPADSYPLLRAAVKWCDDFYTSFSAVNGRRPRRSFRQRSRGRISLD